MKQQCILAIILVMLLSSCSNFRPLYGRDEELSHKLSSIEIEEIDTINGSALYHDLATLLGPSEDTKYLLKITLLVDSISPLAITGHANVVKQNVIQLYEYSLIYKNTGEIVDKGRVRAVGSYDALSSPYASYTKEKILKKDLAKTGAEEIYIRLMLYFSSI